MLRLPHLEPRRLEGLSGGRPDQTQFRLRSVRQNSVLNSSRCWCAAAYSPDPGACLFCSQPSLYATYGCTK
ncbi:unnamed protein product [Dibothriocephalus latus]|uniref:Uncharacterized protein n=1 Tax=Dibothriocephalus latus TaxID=60516 RepID=A0A3P7PFI3_DIBLA|nr:unnamed protein product [Dibothriocephalus latus]